MNQFLLGAIAALCLVAGVFFFRFWRETRDRLFLFFGLAFAIEGVNRTALALSDNPREGDPFFYLVRLGSFLIILYAIWDKNRTAGDSDASAETT
jgi:uncharacterized membrane protein HdeD (DUF308 family)